MLLCSPYKATAFSTRPLNSFASHQRQLARAQRALARKRKFSNNWRKQKAKITRLHSRSANVRADYLHKPHELGEKHALQEDLIADQAYLDELLLAQQELAVSQPMAVVAEE